MNRFGLPAIVLLALGMFAGLPGIAHAAESYDNCTGFITSLPAVVTTQGTWCMKQDLATAISSGAAITINTNNVTIDCNNFKLGGLAAGPGTFADGIDATDRLNLTVRHCNIRGFLTGLNFAGAGGGHVIEDNRLDGNTAIGMRIDGDGSVVRRNLVIDTGGTTTNGDITAISIGYSSDAIDNTVSGVLATSGTNGSATGIFLYGNGDGTIENNRIRGLVPSGVGKARGVTGYLTDRITIRNNILVGDYGTGSVGVECTGTNGQAVGNVINNFVTGINACSNAGGNVVYP